MHAHILQIASTCHMHQFFEQVEEYRHHLAAIAMMGSNSDFLELLPPASRAHLDIASSWGWVRSLSKSRR